MNLPKISFEDSLLKHIILNEKCLGCGACAIVCPFNSLEYNGEKPFVVQECKICGICAEVCPQYKWSRTKMEKFVFNRERNIEEKFGIYQRMLLAQSKDQEVLEHCQDGGVITSFLINALEKSMIDAAVVSDVSKNKTFFPRPKLAKNSKEILRCAGTRYFYSPGLLSLRQAFKLKKEKIAFIGTPCQINAIRKMQQSEEKKFTRSIKILIGLMCSVCFNYEGLIEKYLKNKYKTGLIDLKKMNIKKKLLLQTSKSLKTVPLSEIKKYSRKECKSCNDYSSEFADISAGGLGLKDWTFTIIRTEIGKKLFSSVEKDNVFKIKEINKNDKVVKLLTKSSIKKKQNL